MEAVWIPLLVWSLAWPVSGDGPSPLGKRIGEFALPDPAGRVHKLSEWSDRRLLVVIFLGNDCPLARLYAGRLNELAREFRPRGVAFVGINANQQDAPAKIAEYVQLHALQFPVLKDEDNRIADCFGAVRTPEAFLLDERRVVRYWGRIDDQYEPGGRHRLQATRRDLACAIEDLLDGRPVCVPVTTARGCFIGRVNRSGTRGQVTYSRDIAPILQKRCVSCHRRGQIGPFALTSYGRATAWAETMREVLEQDRMPPWHANPLYGRFANDARMPAEEKELIYTWIRAGMPQGDPKDLPKPVQYSDDWRIPKPDLVLTMPTSFTLPAEGLVDYQYFEVDPDFTEDKWIQAAEMRPGNCSVVHHGLIFLRPPDFGKPVAAGILGSVNLTGMSPGSDPLILPKGMAKRVPAGWKIIFQMHYTTTGSEQVDQSQLGLVFADPQTVKHEVATNMVADFNLWIPPRAAEYWYSSSYQIPENVWLLSLRPHMHVRGKSFRYEAFYPDGGHEILLDVPRYDFNWQTTYRLLEPKVLPKGTTIRCTAQFDNSIFNPANPNPDVVVAWGEQSFDEMMIGYLDLALIDQDLAKGARSGIERLAHPFAVSGMLAACALSLMAVRVYRKHRNILASFKPEAAP